MKKKQIKIGIAGNPNCGKTTIFNAITGLRQKVGNYPGVTVEKKEGRINYKDYEMVIYDLPGIYSLTAYSIDEVVARDFIINEKPDILIDVMDSTNLERNLYLLLQFKELDIPVVGALNIIDQAEKEGITIDDKTLEKLIGVPLVRTIGSREKGINELLDKVIEIFEKREKIEKMEIYYGEEIESEIKKIIATLSEDEDFKNRYSLRWLAVKLLEKDMNAYEKIKNHKNIDIVKKQLDKSIYFLENHFGNYSDIIISEQRYGFIHGAIKETVKRKENTNFKVTEFIDKILLNEFLGLPIFLLIMWAIFQATFTLGQYPMAILENFFSFLSERVSGLMPEGILKSLIVDGIIAGVGGVLSFVPLIVLLFLFISILEDSGYMARAAFIMDKFLHIFGLHGQSFLPLMIGFGCSVPAIMASRTLKSQKDRIITILVTPFMSCGAKLPVHMLLAGAFFKENAANVVMVIYIIGVILALISAKILRITVLKGAVTPFVMELPPYRMPTMKGIFFHVWDKTVKYLKKAGTILLAASILIWALVTFPVLDINQAKYEKIKSDFIDNFDKNSINLSEIQNENITEKISSEKEKVEKEKNNEKTNEKDFYETKEENNKEKIINQIIENKAEKHIETIKRNDILSHSFAGRFGKFIEPILKPIGFDWKIGISIITGFAAKEMVVSTLGVLYKIGTEENEESITLREALQNDPVFNPLVAFVLMLFTLIVTPCFATQSTIKAELGWKWLFFQIAFSILLAYFIGFAVYNLGGFFIK